MNDLKSTGIGAVDFVPEECYYTLEAIEEIKKEAIEQFKKDVEFSRLKENDFYEVNHYLSSLAKETDVIKHKNIMADSYTLKYLLPLINRYGFDEVNNHVMNLIDKKKEGKDNE